MRLRNKPWAEEEIRSHPHLVPPQPQRWKGQWQHFFGNDHPIHIEIGSGKGQFFTEMAHVHPHVNFIGIEIQTSVAGLALRKLKHAHEEKHVRNACLLRENAQDLRDYFAPGEVSRIYLNFSDPWPKKRHGKRRLTHEHFLTLYQHILVKDGEIHLKTDNEGLFEFSLNSFSDFGCRLKNITFDLHRKLSEQERLAELHPDKYEVEQNVMTEYEEKFAAQGVRIYRCEAIVPSQKEG